MFGLKVLRASDFPRSRKTDGIHGISILKRKLITPRTRMLKRINLAAAA